MKHCLNILEIFLIVFLFFLFGAYAVPDVNEAHYLEKAAHFWNPAYASGDFFLNSPDAHGVFYWTFGWLTLYLPLNTVAWIGRIVTWIGLACGWFWMTRPILPRWGNALLTAALFLFLNQSCSCAGEWVVGGVEAKGFAFILIFFALGELLRNHWNRTLLLFGLASTFHILVGGWCLVALGIGWLVLKDYEIGLKRSGKPDDLEKLYLPSLRSILPGLVGAFLLTLPALIPALQLNAGADPEAVKNATTLYVYERLPHHLLLSFIMQNTPQKLVCFGILIVIWNFLSARPRYSNGEMTFRTFIFATLFIAMIGWAINLFQGVAPDTVASLLRYYWFRTADVMLPLGVSILCVEFALNPVSRFTSIPPKTAPLNEKRPSKEERKSLQKEARQQNRTWMRRALLQRKLLFALLIFLAGFQIWQSSARFAKPMKPRSCSGASCGQSWYDLCQFVRENTDEKDVFIVPYTTRTFRWYTGRSEVGVWKDIPQDATGLNEWWARMQEQFYGFDPTKPVQSYGRVSSFTLMPKQKFLFLKKEYNASYLIRNKNDLKGRKLLLDTPNGIEDFELIYENKDFELRKL